MKLVRFLSIVAVAFALVSCGGAEETPTEETEVVTEDGGEEVDLGDAEDGIDEGTAEDFANRVGDTKVNFEFDKYSLTSEARATLRRQAAWLRQFPNVSFVIEGHCDERGTREYNLGLGERRANEVKKYLVAQGVDASRVSTISYGEERPLVNDSTEYAWAQNRRAATVIEE